ncbi:GDCCVxC domain-containing (seleno)protein [Cupriavidus basilensis]|nr:MULTISPECIES: GDCCVxC domain-containing (seleno)protein [Cupriavidus]MDF3887656.1 GDCCVxC domain-containing (seleno)protein [Cupriavidus basilensis]
MADLRKRTCAASLSRNATRHYECSHCKAILLPNLGDCCVFCSFGSVKCPPIQQQRGCCG